MATITGTNLADILKATSAADAFFGLDGEDTASYEDATSGVSVYLVAGGPNSGFAAGDTYSSIENIRGSAFNDLLFGDDGDNKIWGGLGNDTLFGWFGGTNYLYGEGGVDNLVGGPGIDIIDGGSATDKDPDTVSYQLSSAGVTSSLADQSVNTGDAAGDIYTNVEDLTGTPYNDVLYGDSDPVNNLWGLAGNDIIYGGAGYDVMIGDAGADYLDGGADTDMADYETAPSAVVASLLNPAINTGDAAGDVYVSIEDMAGSAYNDWLQGDNSNNNFNAWPGDDTVYGEGGNDGIDGGPGNDWLNGGADTDLLVGGDGDDILCGGAAPDALHGDSGYDVADYRDSAIGLVVNMGKPSVNTGDAFNDSYFSIEAIWGSAHNDVLTGGKVLGDLYGFDGDDVLNGGKGANILSGGMGSDTLKGGKGNDQFCYTSAAEGGDTIVDFKSGQDHIMVTRYWFGIADTGSAAAISASSADFVGAGGPVSTKPTFIYGQATGQLSFDADGTGSGAAVLLATLKAGSALAFSDIWSA